ncbi:hypothetical protein P4H83_19435 [Paenibacillus favisporus]|nr:hypothetical protein [Paenibacillus favisporus]MEC0177056.1 hypothetical protein [Paenibacillus favisporus]
MPKTKRSKPLQDATSAGAYRFADRQASLLELNGSGRSLRNVHSLRSLRN